MPRDVRNLPFAERALLALRAAVKKAIAERTREGLPVYVWSNGKVVDLTAKRRSAARKRAARKRAARKRTSKGASRARKAR